VEQSTADAHGSPLDVHGSPSEIGSAYDEDDVTAHSADISSHQCLVDVSHHTAGADVAHIQQGWQLFWKFIPLASSPLLTHLNWHTSDHLFPSNHHSRHSCSVEN